MMPQAVVFDMDGVLVDSEPLHFATTNEVLARRGARLAQADYDRLVGMAEVPFFALLAERLGLQEAPERLARERVALSLERMARGPLPPRPGALPCLLRLRAEGLVLGLASSATRAQVQLVVGLLGLAAVLDVVVSVEDVARGKPAPDLFQAAMAGLGVEPAACVVVEDAVLGIQAAVAAGAIPIALVPPPGSGEAHEAAGAITTIPSLEVLTPDALEQWCASC